MLPTTLSQPDNASSRKLRSDIAPTTPLTGRTILTPASTLSGIDTDGPL